MKVWIRYTFDSMAEPCLLAVMIPPEEHSGKTGKELGSLLNDTLWPEYRSDTHEWSDSEQFIQWLEARGWTKTESDEVHVTLYSHVDPDLDPLT
jgi:hypothetical protein